MASSGSKSLNMAANWCMFFKVFVILLLTFLHKILQKYGRRCSPIRYPLSWSPPDFNWLQEHFFCSVLSKFEHRFKAMLHEAIFLATRIATNVALQVARKNSRVTPHFATAIVALRVARNVERPSTFRNVARQVACV